MKSITWIVLLLMALAIGYLVNKDDIQSSLSRNDDFTGSAQEFAIHIQGQVFEDLESEFDIAYTPERIGQYIRKVGLEEILDEEFFNKQVERSRQMAEGVQAILDGVHMDEAFSLHMLPDSGISKLEWQQIVSQENKAGLLKSLQSEIEKSFDDHKQAQFAQFKPFYRVHVIRNRVCSKLQSSLTDELESIEEEFGVNVDDKIACTSMAHKWFLTQAQEQALATARQPSGWENYLNPFGYNEMREILVISQ